MLRPYARAVEIHRTRAGESGHIERPPAAGQLTRNPALREQCVGIRMATSVTFNLPSEEEAAGITPSATLSQPEDASWLDAVAMYHKCAVCSDASTIVCHLCRSEWYCSVECKQGHQRAHSTRCESIMRRHLIPSERKTLQNIVDSDAVIQAAVAAIRSSVPLMALMDNALTSATAACSSSTSPRSPASLLQLADQNQRHAPQRQSAFLSGSEAVENADTTAGRLHPLQSYQIRECVADLAKRYGKTSVLCAGIVLRHVHVVTACLALGFPLTIQQPSGNVALRRACISQGNEKASAAAFAGLEAASSSFEWHASTLAVLCLDACLPSDTDAIASAELVLRSIIRYTGGGIFRIETWPGHCILNFASSELNRTPEPGRALAVLLDCGADPNGAALHRLRITAARRKALAPEQAQPSRVTPLHFATTAGSSKPLALLLEHGANPLIDDGCGLLPHHYVVMEDGAERPEMIGALMRAHLASIDPAPSDGGSSATDERRLRSPPHALDVRCHAAPRPIDLVLTNLTTGWAPRMAAFLISIGVDSTPVLFRHCSLAKMTTSLHVLAGIGEAAVPVLRLVSQRIRDTELSGAPRVRESAAFNAKADDADRDGVEVTAPLKPTLLIDTCDEDGTTALVVAAMAGHLGAARVLLEAGADPRASIPRSGIPTRDSVPYLGWKPAVTTSGRSALATANGVLDDTRVDLIQHIALSGDALIVDFLLKQLNSSGTSQIEQDLAIINEALLAVSRVHGRVQGRASASKLSPDRSAERRTSLESTVSGTASESVCATTATMNVGRRGSQSSGICALAGLESKSRRGSTSSSSAFAAGTRPLSQSAHAAVDPSFSATAERSQLQRTTAGRSRMNFYGTSTTTSSIVTKVSSIGPSTTFTPAYGTWRPPSEAANDAGSRVQRSDASLRGWLAESKSTPLQIAVAASKQMEEDAQQANSRQKARAAICDMLKVAALEKMMRIAEMQGRGGEEVAPSHSGTADQVGERVMLPEPAS